MTIDRAKALELIDRFLSAPRKADVEELRSVLAVDVMAIADGGGKVGAGADPVVGIDNVVPLLLDHQSKYRPSIHLRINGQPGIGIFAEDRLLGVVAFDFEPDRIRAIYVVVNPDKLPGSLH